MGNPADHRDMVSEGLHRLEHICELEVFALSRWKPPPLLFLWFRSGHDSKRPINRTETFG